MKDLPSAFYLFLTTSLTVYAVCPDCPKYVFINISLMIPRIRNCIPIRKVISVNIGQNVSDISCPAKNSLSDIRPEKKLNRMMSNPIVPRK